MSRPLRITYPGAWYHIMNRGIAHKNIFLNDKHRQIFMNLLFDIHKRFSIEIHAYCLMDNHYHLLIRTPLPNVSEAMRHLNATYTQLFNKLEERDGPLFRGRFKSILVDADNYLLRLSRYIHLNPVQAGLVKHPEEFRWSSYNFYLSGKGPVWLFTEKILKYFQADFAQINYKNFVEEGVDDEINSFYKKINSPILGSKMFMKLTAENYLEEKHKIREIPEHKMLDTITQTRINNVIKIVASYYSVKTDDLKQVSKRTGNLPRAVGMYLCRLMDKNITSKIAESFTKVSNEGVLKSCRQIHSRMDCDKSLKRDIENLWGQVSEPQLNSD